MSPSIRILLVEHDPTVCTHLRTILGAREDLQVVKEIHDGAGALEAVRRHRPDVVLLDLHLPGVDGPTTIEQLRATRRPPAVVALTTFDSDHHILHALRSGAAGFLLKSTRPTDLIALIRVAAEGHTVLSPEASRRLIATATRLTGPRDDQVELVNRLSTKETDVLTAIGEGLTNAEIATRLDLPEGTVKTYISQILVKLRCANRTQAGLLAYERGLCRRG